MQTNTITVETLFSFQHRYIVPIFQRGYVWTEESQWKYLWNDIREQAERIGADNPQPGKPLKKHFLGAIVLKQQMIMVGHVTSWEIIDGQQRMLTLQLLLAALRDAIPTSKNGDLKSMLVNLTKNVGRTYDSEEAFKVWPTSAHQGDFKDIIIANSKLDIEGKYSYPFPRLVEAYMFFYSKIDGFLHGEDDSTNSGQDIEIDDTGEAIKEEDKGTVTQRQFDTGKAQELFEAIARQVQLVEIQLGIEDDPQVIFESLNARGVQLEPSDLIRNYIFLFAMRNGYNVDDLYIKWWKEFDDEPGVENSLCFWKQHITQGRLTRSRLDQFLFHYVTYRTGQEITINHVYQEFRDWWDDTITVENMDAELDELKRSSDVYKSLTSENGDGRFDLFAERLRELDTTTVYPLVLWLMENKGRLSTRDLNGCFVDLESYFVRRAICRYTAKNYNRLFLAILNRLRNDIPFNRDKLRSELGRFQDTNDEWPSDDDFRSQLIQTDMYRKLRPIIKIKMVLKSIEMASITSKQEDMPLLDTDRLQIEHVMPQNPRDGDYPYSTSDPGDETLELRRKRLKHSLGNLTLLTDSLNASVSNGPFCDKRPEIAKQSKLLLNAYFQKFLNDFQWDEEAITERGKQLAATVLKIWPGPD